MVSYKNIVGLVVVLACVWQPVIMSDHTFSFQPAVSFDHEKRHSSYPFISSNTFRTVAQHHIDETNRPFDPCAVEQGDIIYVRAYPQFLDKLVGVLAKIKNAFILLTHSSDETMPGKYRFLLDDPRLIAWFAENKGAVSHDKLVAIPIGLADPYYPHGDVGIITEAIAATRNIGKKHFLYVNFATHTNANRNAVLQQFQKKPFCFAATQKPWGDYLKDLASSYFVLSPPGNGMDCHRSWEALLMGSIPVMQSTSIDCLFDELPVVIVQNWNQVTKDFLEKQYKELKQKTHNFDKLYADYWLDKIKMVQAHARR